MTEENQTAGTGGDITEETETAAAETTEETSPAETAAPSPAETLTETESKSALPRTLAAKAAFDERKRAAEETKTAPSVPEVSTKGLFVEEQAKRQPTLWDLFDILCSVKWQLMDRKWAMEWVDGVEDNYDYVGEYSVACQEFAAAAVKSFAYYGGFEFDANSAPDSEDVTDDIIENALDIQKSFEVFAELFQKSPEENRPTLQSIGDQIVELAREKGIPLPAEAAHAAAEPAEEFILKSQSFLDMETRAKAAETRVEELQQKLDVATAGLEVAVEAIKKELNQPLQLNGKN